MGMENSAPSAMETWKFAFVVAVQEFIASAFRVSKCLWDKTTDPWTLSAFVVAGLHPAGIFKDQQNRLSVNILGCGWHHVSAQGQTYWWDRYVLG